jgi:hypothetical protein
MKKKHMSNKRKSKTMEVLELNKKNIKENCQVRFYKRKLCLFLKTGQHEGGIVY